MSVTSACQAIFPAFACLYTDLFVYLAPSIGLAVIIRFLARTHPIFFLFTLAGTFCHELAHFFVGLLVGARPASMNLVPNRSGRNWELGSVTFRNIRWYNAAPTALAPMLIIIIPFLVAAWRVSTEWKFELQDIVIAFLLAPQFLSFWPSSMDWRVALRSWPYLLMALAGYWLGQNAGMPAPG